MPLLILQSEYSKLLETSIFSWSRGSLRHSWTIFSDYFMLSNNEDKFWKWRSQWLWHDYHWSDTFQTHVVKTCFLGSIAFFLKRIIMYYGMERKQGLYCNNIQKDWPFNPNTRRRKYNDIEYVSIPQHIPRELLSMMRFCAVLYSVRCSNSDSSSGRPKLFLPLVLLLQAESSASDFCCGRSLIT